MNELVKMQHISKSFDRKMIPIVDDLNFAIEKGKLYVLLGPSGAGKSTFLNLISGDLEPNKGMIERDCRISFLKQSSQFPEGQSVYQILENSFNHEDKHQQIHQVLEAFGLQSKDGVSPENLSTGQQQRLAFARSLISSPELLILDEPFSCLEESLSREILNELIDYLNAHSITCLIATHQLDLVCDSRFTVIFFNHGKILQQGLASEFYWKPHSLEIAHFFGYAGIVIASVLGHSDAIEVESIFGRGTISRGNLDGSEGQIYLMIRPEAIFLDTNGTQGEIVGITEKRGGTLVEIKYLGHQFKVYCPIQEEAKIVVGNQIGFKIFWERVHPIPI